MADPQNVIYFDAQTTNRRVAAVKQAMPAKPAPSERPAPPVPPVFEPAEPDFLPGSSLSFNEALQKIDYCSKL